jgi:hypothetical protein
MFTTLSSLKIAYAAQSSIVLETTQAGRGLLHCSHPTHPSPRPPPRPCRVPVSTGHLDDLLSFDLANMTWALLSAADDAGRPSVRYGHGFTSAGGRLYVHGGYIPTDAGDMGEAGANAVRGIMTWVGLDRGRRWGVVRGGVRRREKSLKPYTT